MNSRQTIRTIPGLSVEYNAEIAEIMSRHPEVERVVLYGSRAKGTHTNRSDIDLALMGSSIGDHTLGDIKLDLDESDVPLSIDVLIYATLENQDLKAHIDRVGLTLYTKKNSE